MKGVSLPVEANFNTHLRFAYRQYARYIYSVHAFLNEIYIHSIRLNLNIKRVN